MHVFLKPLQTTINPLPAFLHRHKKSLLSDVPSPRSPDVAITSRNIDLNLGRSPSHGNTVFSWSYTRWAPDPIISGVIFSPINGRKSMGNWGDFTLLIGVITPLITGRGPTLYLHQKLNGTESQRTPDPVICDRAIGYSGFFGVRETWVLWVRFLGIPFEVCKTTVVVVVAVVFHGVFLFVCNLLPVVRPFVAISGRVFVWGSSTMIQ